MMKLSRIKTYHRGKESCEFLSGLKKQAKGSQMKLCVLAFLVVVIATSGFSQTPVNYPQNYFRNPLGIPIQLAASFGELRPNHFHMGLDIRTQSRENLPVYAVADGYVSRVKIEEGGYGNGLYIIYDKGYVTVYAHLNAFYKPLADYIKTKQYETESWEQDLIIPEGMFPVKKGQFVAYSGNTGASGGPHLHFEVRDAVTENNLNPQLFGFEIPDRIVPAIHGLYWYDRRYSTYQVGPNSIPISGAGGNYKTASKVVKVGSPVISLGMRTTDKSSNSPFTLGIYHAELWMDGTLANIFTINDFSYDDTRYINACIDYKKYRQDKVYIQHLSVLPGNKLNIFEGGGKGILSLDDEAVHDVRIVVEDVTGNTSTVEFSLQYDPSLKKDYMFTQNSVSVYPDRENFLQSANAKVRFSRFAFYDEVPFVMSEQDATSSTEASPLISLSNYEIPVHDFYTVDVKTSLPANDALRNKTVIQLTTGTSKVVQKGTWSGDWMQGRFNRLGKMQLLVDNIPPLIVPVGWNNGSVFISNPIKIKCTDNLDAIASFRAELDGKWLMFSKKGDYFTYHFDEHCSDGKHQLVVTVTDVAGNETQKTFEFVKR